ncbi:MAG: DsbA family oxidoreductase [Neisseriaceae bacterium]|nr:DsbA family oxidoreductase [Neisseriaceae bacterium]MBP6860793.1 DsbA family oxidoreductase [Neisseriaceae bacterium]
MQVQVWSDFACPYCYIGQHNLAQGMAKLNEVQRGQIQLIHRSFELAPEALVDNPQSKYEQLAQKYTVSIERAKAMGRQATSMAESVGLSMDYDKVIMTNTFAAHQLAHFAAAEGKGTAMQRALFEAHFVTGKHIGDEAVLQTLAEAQGLSPKRVAEVLANNVYAAAVRDDEALAQRLQISSVPFVVLDNRYAISGAQSADYFAEALVQVLQEGSQQATPQPGRNEG